MNILKKKNDSNFSPLFFICITCCGVIKHPGANLQGNKRDCEGEEGVDPCEQAQALWEGRVLVGRAQSEGLQHPQPHTKIPGKRWLWGLTCCQFLFRPPVPSLDSAVRL